MPVLLLIITYAMAMGDTRQAQKQLPTEEMTAPCWRGTYKLLHDSKMRSALCHDENGTVQATCLAGAKMEMDIPPVVPSNF